MRKVHIINLEKMGGVEQLFCSISMIKSEK